MSASDHLNEEQFPQTLYRGEGNHDKPSPYYNVGPNKSHAGGWWTSNVDKAHNYAASRPEGKVYSLEAHEHEAQPRGARGNYFITDPEVRARRTLYDPKA
jgi:hypothetical protein